jgi:hypothetical protein
VVVSNRTGIDLDEAWVVYDGSAWPLGSLPSGETSAIQGPRLNWTTGLIGSPDPGDTLWTGSTWMDTWSRLDEPWDEHVARLHVSARSHPVLIGFTRGGVAPPMPVDNNFVTSAYALVRAPLIDLDPEVLP